MRLEFRQALEPPPRDAGLLHIPHPRFILPLRPRPIRSAGLRPEPPVLREGQKTMMEHHFPRRCVVVLHQRLGVVRQHRLRDTPDLHESALQSLEPVALPFPGEHPHVHPTRTTERRHEQPYLRLLPTDPDLALAEINLQLIARRRLKSGRRHHRRP